MSRQQSALIEKLHTANIRELKHLIRYILTSDNIEGNDDEVCILADLKTAIGLYSEKSAILTKKQRAVIVENLIKDRPQVEIAEQLHITQQGVSILLRVALRRIQQYIMDIEILWTSWEPEHKDYVMTNYGKIPVAQISNTVSKSVNRVISMYHYLKNKQREV